MRHHLFGALNTSTMVLNLASAACGRIYNDISYSWNIIKFALQDPVEMYLDEALSRVSSGTRICAIPCVSE